MTGARTSRTRPTWSRSLREIDLDIAEGADLVMVKPAMSYLDVVAAAAERLVGAGGGVPGLGGVRDDLGGRRERLDRPQGCGARVAPCRSVARAARSS